MVYAEGIEVLRHFTHAGAPPGIVVFGHLFPVVGGEAPVLAVGGKGIRRCTSLAVHVEEFRVLPGVNAHAGYADGKVSLQGHAVQVGIVHGFPQLLVQQELHVAVEAYLGRMFFGKGRGFLGGVGGHLAPFLEFRTAMLVPQHAEHGVREEPVPVGIGKGLVFVGGHYLLTLGAGVQLAQHLQLGAVHGLVIDGREGLQFGLFGLVGGILAHTGGGQMDELRMQGEGAHRVVRVGVLPGMGHGGVVDGQQLNHVLVGLHRPVHQALDVVEFTHAEALFRPEGEHGNGHAGASPGLRGELGLQVGNNKLGILGRHFPEEMVGAFLPQLDSLGLAVHNHKFVFHGLCDVHGNEPPGEAGIREQFHLFPLAHFLAGAHQAHGLVAADLSNRDADAHVAQIRSLIARMAEGSTVRTTENDVAEGRCIEGRIGRSVHPAGTYDDVLLGRRGFEMMLPPFFLDDFTVPHNLEGEGISVVDVPAGEHDLPQPSVRIFHGDAAFAQAELDALAPLGVVLQLDIGGHSLCVVLYG